jgi:hypothetical protein
LKSAESTISPHYYRYVYDIQRLNSINNIKCVFHLDYFLRAMEPGTNKEVVAFAKSKGALFPILGKIGVSENCEY